MAAAVRACAVALLCAAAGLPAAAGTDADTAPAMALPEASASGFFLNAGGQVLTAWHAVARCPRLYVTKEGRVAEARLAAHSAPLDLAVLDTGIRPHLSATLHTGPDAIAASGGQAVFAEGYAALQRLPERSRLLSNALVVQGSGSLHLMSGAQPGASGAAVLDHKGLVLGAVVERVAAGPGGSAHTLSQGPGHPIVAGRALVHAVPVAQIADFLRAHGIAFTESSQPQLGPQQFPGARAWTLAAGVVCG